MAKIKRCSFFAPQCTSLAAGIANTVVKGVGICRKALLLLLLMQSTRILGLQFAKAISGWVTCSVISFLQLSKQRYSSVHLVNSTTRVYHLTTYLPQCFTCTNSQTVPERVSEKVDMRCSSA